MALPFKSPHIVVSLLFSKLKISAMLPNLSVSGFFEIDNPYRTLNGMKPLIWKNLFYVFDSVFFRYFNLIPISLIR